MSSEYSPGNKRNSEVEPKRDASQALIDAVLAVMMSCISEFRDVGEISDWMTSLRVVDEREKCLDPSVEAARAVGT